MRSRSQYFRFSAAAVTAIVIACLAIATPASAHFAPLVRVYPEQAPSGTEVTVTVYAVPGTTEVRWATADGPLLGSATTDDRSFTVNVTIPQAAPGVYYLRAVQDGEIKISGAFEVTPSPSEPPTTDAPQTAAPQAAAPSVQFAAAVQATSASATSVAVKRRPVARTGPRTRTTARPAVRARRAAGSGAPARRAIARPAPTRIAVSAAPQTSGRPVVAGSQPHRTRGPQRESQRGASPASRAAANSSIPRSDEHLSLASTSGSSAPDGGLGHDLAIGAALLGLGLLAPLAGFLFAETRTRRVSARPSRRRRTD